MQLVGDVELTEAGTWIRVPDRNARSIVLYYLAPEYVPCGHLVQVATCRRDGGEIQRREEEQDRVGQLGREIQQVGVSSGLLVIFVCPQ
jgi:hypothetical protein